MLQRRRLSATPRQPIMAVVLTVALAASAMVGIGGNHIIHTQQEGSNPVKASLESEPLSAGTNVVVNDPAIATQGTGNSARTVKEFTRKEEFSMFALSWEGNQDVAAFVRAQDKNGAWGPWYPVDPIDATDDQHKPKNGKTGSELTYVEPTTKIQVSTSNVDLLSDGTAKSTDKATSPAIDPAKINAIFIDGKPAEGKITLAAESNDTTGMPTIVTREGWGADESIRCQQPDYDDRTSAITIHHTAGSNNYTPEQSAGIMRGIYQYHAQQLGWCDVGYHSLVDKYGTIYEGRYGGMNKPVQGVHAGGFNENTWAISIMGNYDLEEPTDAAINAVGNLAGWRARVAGIDPNGSDTHISEGSSYTRYPLGQSVTLPNIFAHRDVGDTACPGQHVYDRMDQIRKIATQTNSHGNAAGSNANSNTETSTSPSTTKANTSESTSTTPSTSTAPSSTRPSTSNNTSTDLSSLAKATTDGKYDLKTSLPVVGTILGLVASNSSSDLKTTTTNNSTTVPGLKLDSLTSIAGTLAPLLKEGNMVEAIKKLAQALAPTLGGSRAPAQQARSISERNSEVGFATFDKGVVVSSPEAGTHAVWGPIGDAWAEQGFDTSKLGLPLNEEYQDGELKRVDFQGGYITYNPTTQQTQVHV